MSEAKVELFINIISISGLVTEQEITGYILAGKTEINTPVFSDEFKSKFAKARQNCPTCGSTEFSNDSEQLNSVVCLCCSSELELIYPN